MILFATMSHICSNGHDKRIVGRTPTNHCILCKYLRQQISRCFNDYAKSARMSSRRRRIKNVPVIEAQPGYPCDSCKRPIEHQPYCDHDHNNGEFRGWLCVRCNTALGVVDNAVLLQQLIAYKERTTKE